MTPLRLRLTIAVTLIAMIFLVLSPFYAYKMRKERDHYRVIATYCQSRADSLSVIVYGCFDQRNAKIAYRRYRELIQLNTDRVKPE